MDPALIVLTRCIVALGALALLLWGLLLLHRVLDNRRQRRLQQLQEVWLERLLPVLEGAEPAASLPRVRDALTMDAVLTLLRELLERFRGQYSEALRGVLHHIGAEAYGLRLLGRWRSVARLRGCALLAWTGSTPATAAALRARLGDRRPQVRLEAAWALAQHGAPGSSLREILPALEQSGMLKSERARDIVRRLAPGRGDELAALLEAGATDRARVLLLEGLALCGDAALAERAAVQLKATGARVREAAVRTLERLADPLYIGAVTALATDADAGVRKAVAEYTVAMCADTEARNILYWLIHDANFDVQRTAIHGLARHGGAPWQRLQSQAAKSPLLEALIAEAAKSPVPQPA